MTSVTFTKYHESYIFECVGHTGYASAGRDILCSAVSVLCYTLDSYLSRAFSEGKITNYCSYFEGGNVRISFELCDTYPDEIALSVARAIIDGFVLLEESFPDYIKTDI